MPIRPEHIVNLQGRNYVVFPGLLNLAHESGLRCISTKLIQIPSAENGNCAIIQATALFKGQENDEHWSAYGDASPANTRGPIQTALIRMAETRAIGRVLRMACNVGETMLEELGGDDETGQRPNGHPPQPARPPAPPQRVSEAPAGAVKCRIDDCHIMLTEAQRAKSQAEANMDLCAVHLAKMKAGIAG